MPGPTQPTAGPPRDLAPPWHTATLVALFVAVAALGLSLTRRGVAVQLPFAAVSRGVVYAQMIVVSWGLFFYVCRLGRPRNALPQLLGQRWHSVRRALTDVALAAAVWFFIKGCELLWLKLFPTAASTVAGLLPQTPLQALGWVAVALSVGISEEVVFRGYLQTQLTAFSGRASLALFAQALLFGLAHAEQGLGAMLRLTLYGLAFGVLARARASLLPGILCHVWTNLASGLLHT